MSGLVLVGICAREGVLTNILINLRRRFRSMWCKSCLVLKHTKCIGGYACACSHTKEESRKIRDYWDHLKELAIEHDGLEFLREYRKKCEEYAVRR